MYQENIGELMEFAAQNTTFTGGVSYSEGDKVVAMSTCSYEYNDARYVVLAIMR
jgi:sortase B